MNKDETKKKNSRNYFKYIILDVLIAALVSVLLITYVASAYKIEGNSMQTVLHDQERVIIAKWGISEKDIHRYDIVVLHKPDENSRSIIKRVIGLPEEIIEIRKGNVYINGRILPEPYLPREKDIMYQSIELKPLLIPEGHFFVIGDNRPVSYDSRVFGPVPSKYIYGKTLFRYWPFSRFGKIK